MEDFYAQMIALTQRAEKIEEHRKTLKQEPTMIDYTVIGDLYRAILIELGFNVKSEGLQETPARIARFWKEFLDYSPGNLETTFEAVETDQMVIVKDIPFHSLCEHHLLPFYGKVSIAYLTGNKVVGLSKIPRIVQKHAHKLQLQERLANDILDELNSIIPDNQGLAIVIEGVHMCMQMRGIKSDGKMLTSLVKGDFREDTSTRMEFLTLLRGG